MQKYYVKVAESIVLGKEEVKKIQKLNFFLFTSNNCSITCTGTGKDRLFHAESATWNPGSPIILLGAIKLNSWLKKTLISLLPHLARAAIRSETSPGPKAGAPLNLWCKDNPKIDVAGNESTPFFIFVFTWLKQLLGTVELLVLTCHIKWSTQVLDVVIYIYPTGRKELDTLHMTSKGIKEESTHRDQGFFQQILCCSSVVWQGFNVLSRGGSVILWSTPMGAASKTGAEKACSAQQAKASQAKALTFYLTHFRSLLKKRLITPCFSPLLLKLARHLPQMSTLQAADLETAFPSRWTQRIWQLSWPALEEQQGWEELHPSWWDQLARHFTWPTLRKSWFGSCKMPC